MSPLCETFLTPDQLDQGESFYPLHVRVCERCFLVQLRSYVPPEDIFTEYAYFSSYSDSWVRHAATYTTMITERLGLGAESQVVELASNDGYLLQHFVARGIPVLGIEPAANVAEAAIAKGVPTIAVFFGEAVARDLVAQGRAADLIVANNVLAHVPDLNDFVAGIKALLGERGVFTGEFPHLLRLMEENQFDTIYHEHFSYLSFAAIERVFAAHGLTLFDVDQIPTHGGSLRIYARHTGEESWATTSRVAALRAEETAARLDDLATYEGFGERVAETKRKLLEFLIDAKRAGKTVVGYGAPGKGNTLLNYCGIRTDLLDYTVDRNPYKHGRFLPGTHIPVYPTERIAETRPDYILILPWNLRKEIVAQLEYAREWGAQFVTPIPEVRIY
jgi:SAM-dependent methyltransferase